VKVLNTKSAPQPIGPYSQGIEADGLILLSGQIGLHPETGELMSGLSAQTKQALENARAVLESAGSSLSDVIKTTIYLRNISDFAEFNRVYSEYFRKDPPSRTTVAVSGLPKDALIEIEIIARK